jgi:hypothetical protein
MREVLLVSISALLGYIIFSAFSTTDTPTAAFRKIIEQPQSDMKQRQEFELNKLNNARESTLISLQNQDRLNELKAYQEIKINEKENNTKVELKEIDYRMNHDITDLQLKSDSEIRSKDNATLIVIAFLLFLLMFIYLKYQKQLNQIEIEKENHYNEMIAKKEYAEKILMLLSTGNLTYETEQKLLKVLDQLNGKEVKSTPDEIIYHPNPDIAQLGSKIVS